MIIGAGFAGLITAHILKREPLFDAAPAPLQNHKALLRFRSDEIGKLTGIPFKQVRVRKGIFLNGAFTTPNIHIANAYSQKCLGGKIRGDRSIWDIEPATRYIAPEDFYDQLIESIGDRITWNAPVKFTEGMANTEAVITTAPLHFPATALKCQYEDEKFLHAAITVARYRVPACEAYQTIYFPTGAHSMYRASITGNLLMCEFAGDPSGEWQEEIRRAFCIINTEELQNVGVTKQRYGKIAPISEIVRKRLVHELTAQHRIFSIGRFATWRNILLDDLIKDANVIKNLLSCNGYDLHRKAFGGKHE